MSEKRITNSTGEKNIFRASAAEFGNLRVIVFCGLMGALSIVLDMFGSVAVGPYVKIGLASIPNRTVDYLFGPVVGCAFGAVMDLLKFMIHPTGTFFPGYTLSAAAAGFLFGWVMYRKPLSLPRLLAGQFILKLFVNLFLNTLWMVIMYQKAVMVILPPRIISNAIQLPVDALILWFLFKALDKSGMRRMLYQ